VVFNTWSERFLRPVDGSEVKMSALTSMPLEEIEDRHLSSLIENKVPEGRDNDL